LSTSATTPAVENDEKKGDSQQREQGSAVEQETNDGSQAQLEDPGVADPIADNKPLQTAMVQLIQHFAGLEKYARRTEVMDSRRQRFYRRQDQYIVWNTAQYLFGPWPGNTSDSPGASSGQDSPRYTDVYDIFWPYMRILMSVGTQNAPGVNFEPDDPTQESDITSARAAEKYRHFIDRVNERAILQADILSKFCTDGRTVLYTRPVADAQKFGVDKDGSPHIYPKMEAFGVLENKVVPITAKAQDDLIALFLSDEPEINMAKKTYPEHAPEIKEGQSGVGESAYERNARIGVLQGTKLLQQAGDAYAHLTTRHRVFLRPAAFEHAPDAVRDQLKSAYPHGAKVWICGDAYCRSIDKAFDDQLTIGFPAPGDGMNRSSMMRAMVPVQDAFNDYKNLEKEYADWGIPTVYRLTEAGDIEALREQTAEPGNNVTVELPAGINSLADCFFVEPAPTCPIEILQAYQDLRGALAQFIVGAPPALFGGSDEHNETKGGIAMLRDQAMGQYSMCWGALQRMFASGYKQAVLAITGTMDGEAKINLQVPGKRGTKIVTSITGEELTKGNFHATPDSDSSFPETSGAKRQVIQMLWTQAATDPMAAQALGLMEPDNLELTRETFGITDWTIPGANARDKQMGEIDQLLATQPATPSPQAIIAWGQQQALLQAAAQKLAPLAPPPPPPEMVPMPMALPNQTQPDGKPVMRMVPVPRAMLQPTVPINKYDFDQFEFQTIKDWLSEPDGINARKTNPLGVLNVELHGDLHEQAMKAKMPPAPMLPAPPPKIPGKVAPQIPPPSPGAQPGPMNAAIQ
jgi:hypothetical protein